MRSGAWANTSMIRAMQKKEQLCIQTLSGPKTLHMTVENGQAVAAKVDMGPAEFSAKKIPVALPMDRVIDQAVTIGGKQTRITCVSMGNPHAVVFVEDVQDFPLEQVGPGLEKHPRFPKRVNAEFVKILDEETIEMRVWERGSGITQACGTGACATAVAAFINELTGRKSDVIMDGGPAPINGMKSPGL